MHPSRSRPDRSFEHGNPLQEFQYGQIDLLPGAHQAQLEQTHALLMGLDENSLLRPFRTRAGLEAPGVELGGWYSSTGFCPAHSFGQWLSALSRYYAITGDEVTRAKVHRLVDGFSATIEPEGKFYKRYPNARGYSYDLLALGLIEAHRLTNHPGALTALTGTTRAASKYLPGKAVPIFGKLVGEPDEKCYDHTYVIPENQFIAWQQGGDDLHLQMAKQYLFDEVFDPLSRGENILGGLHAYTYENALSSAARAYLVLGDEKYLRAAKNGFDFIDAQSYATGGSGPNESFLPAPENLEYKLPRIESLYDSLARTRHCFETPCGGYAHLKLTRYLLRITKDSRYGDSLERVMYNTVLGAKPLQADGRAFYNSDYSPGARKVFHTKDAEPEMARWPCCAGSLPQVAADYRICAYFKEEDDVYVNLYIPSTLRWNHRGAAVSLTQSGDYPLGDLVSFRIAASTRCEFTLRFRIPAWAKSASLRVNGQTVNVAIKPGTFAALKRAWGRDDHIELELRRKLELKSIDPGHPDTVALLHGPAVLFALASTTPSVTRKQLLATKRLPANNDEWTADTASGPLRFLPWWKIDDESYCTYLSVTDE